MLAQKDPRSFVSGNKVDLGASLKEYNRNEFHHIYPRAFLRAGDESKYDEGCLANICFMSKSDNNELGGVAPSQYRKKMPQAVDVIIESNVLPGNTFQDNYGKFVEERSEMLLKEAQNLLD